MRAASAGGKVAGGIVALTAALGAAVGVRPGAAERAADAPGGAGVVAAGCVSHAVASSANSNSRTLDGRTSIAGKLLGDKAKYMTQNMATWEQRVAACYELLVGHCRAGGMEETRVRFPLY